jgi:hypothetical protein
MAEIAFSRNDLTVRDAELARRVEAEIGDALRRQEGRFECRIEARSSAGGALDVVVVTLDGPDTLAEWTLAPPLTPGDVQRAAEHALAGRRTRSDRRHPGRSPLDRRQT